MRIINCIKRSKQECITVLSTFFTAVSLIGIDFNQLSQPKKIRLLTSLESKAPLKFSLNHHSDDYISIHIPLSVTQICRFCNR